MKCAIYARVSTSDQNCEMQLRELRTYAERRQWTITGEFVDTGFSGAKASRPQLDKLMREASARTIDCILVWKLDRFGRSVVHLSQALQQLKSWGVRFMAVTQGIDTDQNNPTASLMLNILASVAEFEREMIRERVKAGMEVARSKGVYFGGKRKVFDRELVCNLKKAGKSTRQIAKEVGISVGTVISTLQAAGLSRSAEPIKAA